jgi:FMN phosphatase YigB (HAD superfamily)
MQRHQGIKNILFDFGNVILDLDIPATTYAFRALMADDAAFETASRTHVQHRLFERYETGQISEAAFFEALRATADRPFTDAALREAWNAMLLGLPAHRFGTLTALRPRYRLFMLSNTNATHIAWVHDYLLRTYGMRDFEQRFFDKVYYSHEIGHRKPDAAAFRFVLDDAGIAAHETLFVDDVPENTAAAASLGFQTLTHRFEAEDVAQALARALEHSGKLSI